jgi:hypothetical protein
VGTRLGGCARSELGDQIGIEETGGIVQRDDLAGLDPQLVEERPVAVIAMRQSALPCWVVNRACK